MESKKLPELKIEKNVKVKVSKNGKWISHILSDQGLMVTFSMKYYRSILKAYPEDTLNNDSEISDEQKILARMTLVMNEVTSFNSWLSKCGLDCQALVLGQISAKNVDFANKELNSDMLKFVTETLNGSIDRNRSGSEKTQSE
ncbi:MAG: hypothetical protein AABY64_14530 [Bdellovibrionota bacterium]